jgi:hypothetical protein
MNETSFSFFVSQYIIENKWLINKIPENNSFFIGVFCISIKMNKLTFMQFHHKVKITGFQFLFSIYKRVFITILLTPVLFHFIFDTNSVNITE